MKPPVPFDPAVEQMDANERETVAEIDGTVGKTGKRRSKTVAT